MKNAKLLVIRNVQNAFISGELKQPDAKKILPKIKSKIKRMREIDTILVLNERSDDKLYARKVPKKFASTVKSSLLEASDGFKIEESLEKELESEFTRLVFAVDTPSFTKWDDVFASDMPKNVEFTGTCLDSSIIADVATLKSFYPEVNITIQLEACSASTPEMKESAAVILESFDCDVKRKASTTEKEKKE